MKNFGQIKNHIINRLTKAYVDGQLSENKELQKFFKIIKESEILKTEFSIYRNLEKFTESNEFIGSEFLKNNLAIMESFSKNDIIAEHKKLVEAFSIDELSEVSNEKLASLYESITNLLFLEKTTSNVAAITEATANAVNFFKENVITEKKQRKVVNNELLKSVAKDKIKEHYDGKLNDDELAIVESIVKGDSNKQEELLKSMVKECLGFINTHIAESSVDRKERLLNVKSELLDITYVSETYKKDIKRVLTLLNGFKES